MTEVRRAIGSSAFARRLSPATIVARNSLLFTQPDAGPLSLSMCGQYLHRRKGLEIDPMRVPPDARARESSGVVSIIRRVSDKHFSHADNFLRARRV